MLDSQGPRISSSYSVIAPTKIGKKDRGSMIGFRNNLKKWSLPSKIHWISEIEIFKMYFFELALVPP